MLQEALSGAQAVPVPAPDGPAVRTRGDSSGHPPGWVCHEHQAPARAAIRRRSSQRALCRAAGCGQALWQRRREGTQSQHPLGSFPFCPNAPRNKDLAFSSRTSDFPSDAIVFWLLFQTRGNFLAQRLGVCIRSFSLSRIQLGALGALEIL